MSDEELSAQHAAQRDALDQMIQSEGWRLFLEYVDEQWGPDAQMRRVDDALEGLKALGMGQPGAQVESVTTVRSTARQIEELFKWPKTRIGQLTPKPASTTRFAGLRRGPS